MSFLIWIIKDPIFDLSEVLKNLNLDFLLKDFIKGEKILVLRFRKLHINDLSNIENSISDLDPIMMFIVDSEIYEFISIAA